MNCQHATAADPRKSGSCMKCGRTYTPEKDPTRDLVFEAEFLADVIVTARHTSGITNAGYQTRVNQRLDIGRERYGDGDFMSKDNLKEVLEETPDLASYAMLELQRLRAQNLSEDVYRGVYMDLVAVASYGAIADYYAQRAALRLRGLE